MAQTREISIKRGKVASLGNLLSDGVMSAPGVVSNGKVVHADGVHHREKVEPWLTVTARTLNSSLVLAHAAICLDAVASDA